MADEKDGAELTQQPELKSCPFCGYIAIMVDHSEEQDGRLTLIECGNDDCECTARSMPFHENSTDTVIAAWNTRASDALLTERDAEVAETSRALADTLLRATAAHEEAENGVQAVPSPAPEGIEDLLAQAVNGSALTPQGYKILFVEVFRRGEASGVEKANAKWEKAIRAHCPITGQMLIDAVTAIRARLTPPAAQVDPLVEIVAKILHGAACNEEPASAEAIVAAVRAELEAPHA